MSIVVDDEPLHTLAARFKTLAAVSETCRELRDIVRICALPELDRRFVTPRPGTVTPLYAAATAAIPTVESLVRKNDYELAVIEQILCTFPASTSRLTRSDRIDRLLALGDNGGGRWRLVGLKRELMESRRRTLTLREAVVRYRIKPEDIPEPLAGPPYRRDDLAAIALAKHGGQRQLQAKDAAIRASCKKREDTIREREARRVELRDAFMAASRSQEYDDVVQSSVAVHDATQAYVIKGTDRARAAANERFAECLRAMRERKTAVDAMPWPFSQLLGSMAPTGATAAVRARDDYVVLGDEADLARTVGFSSKWSRALELLAGVPDAVRRSSPAVLSALCVFLGEEGEHGPAAALGALSDRYADVVARATDAVSSHPRASRISATIPTVVGESLVCDSPGDADDVEEGRRAMAASVAEKATTRACTAFCDEVWKCHVRPMLTGDSGRRMNESACRRYADPSLRSLWTAPNAGPVAGPVVSKADAVRVASEVEQQFIQSKRTCMACKSNPYSSACAHQLCRPCCRARSSSACAHHRRT